MTDMAVNSAAPAALNIKEMDPKPECDFEWSNPDLKKFWEGCFPAGYNAYILDGLHPKALCSKICNDVLRTNINLNSGSTNPNDRILCFDVLGNLEAKLIQAGVIKQPTQKPTGNPNHLAYIRVTHTDWNKASAILGSKSLESWARAVVEESIKRLQQGRSKQA